MAVSVKVCLLMFIGEIICAVNTLTMCVNVHNYRCMFV